MSAEVIQFRGRNELGYAHVVCCRCGGNGFHVRTDEIDGRFTFCSLICLGCKNEIYVDLKPVYQPGEGD